MTALVPDEPKAPVTIILPARNEERHIARCLDSLLSQDYQGICEILVFDSISHDRTRRIRGRDFKKKPGKDVIVWMPFDERFSARR